MASFLPPLPYEQLAGFNPHSKRVVDDIILTPTYLVATVCDLIRGILALLCILGGEVAAKCEGFGMMVGIGMGYCV